MSKSRIKQFLFRQIEAQKAASSRTHSALANDALLSEKIVSTRSSDTAMDLATALMRKHGLIGWQVKFDNARRRAGQCDFFNQTISLSRFYIGYADVDHIRDTILHEIAHALAGPHHGHDAVWRQIAQEIGCSAKRCHNLVFAKAKWLMRCPKGCFEVERHRRKSALVCASCKIAVEFVPYNPVGDSDV